MFKVITTDEYNRLKQKEYTADIYYKQLYGNYSDIGFERSAELLLKIGRGLQNDPGPRGEDAKIIRKIGVRWMNYIYSAYGNGLYEKEDEE